MNKSVFNLIIGAIPLLIYYPIIYMACMMGLAGHTTGNEPLLLMLLTYSFLLATLAYPLVYFICLIGTWIQKNKDNAERWSSAPLKYLLVIMVLIFLSVIIGKIYQYV